MSQIVLDFSSGNTCRNEKTIVMNMIKALREVDTGKHEIIIKWQLFQHAGENIPLSHVIFDFAYQYAEMNGYKTTASVFDKISLDFLLQYNPIFVKIANNRSLDYLIGYMPRNKEAYVSIGKADDLRGHIEDCIKNNVTTLMCISKYPATIEDYEKEFTPDWLNRGNISDHTCGLDLFKQYQPAIWEKHYKLPDSTGLDAGPFAILPSELAEVL